MIRKYSPLLLYFSVLVFLIPLCGLKGENANDILSKIQKKYDTIRDASVRFSQHIRFGVMSTDQTFNGKFLMKKGGMYRVEGEEQTIVTDGKSVWTFTKSNRQVIVDTYKDDPKSFSPDKVLVNVPKNYFATLLPDEKSTKDLAVLKLIPKDEKSQVKWMKVWIDRNDWLMQKIQIQDISDNLTTYTLSDIVLNGNLQDSVFTFSAPEGVEVIDLR